MKNPLKMSTFVTNIFKIFITFVMKFFRFDRQICFWLKNLKTLSKMSKNKILIKYENIENCDYLLYTLLKTPLSNLQKLK